MTSSELVLELVTQLEGSLTRVSDDLTNLAKLKVQKLPDIAALSPEMAAITMEGAIEAIEPIVQEITSTISEDRGLMEEWKKSSIKFRGEDKSDAEKWISAFRKTRKVDETISALKSLRRDHSLVVTEARTLYKKARAAMPRAAVPAAAAPAPAPIAPSFKLPEVKLPMFDGDIGSFQSLWGLFTTIVDGAHASPEQKFSLLKTKLMGEPLNLVRDLPLTAANYDSAKNLLNDRYGNPKAIARQVRAQLFALPQCKSRHEVKEVYYHAEALLIQLEAITGSQCNSDEILQFLEQRLPGYYLERLINKRRPVVDWDLRQFRVLMPQLISEDLEILQVTHTEKQASANNQTRVRFNVNPRNPLNKTGQRAADDRQYGSMAFTTMQQNKPKSILKKSSTFSNKPTLPQPKQSMINSNPKPMFCIFCKQTGHRAVQCHLSPNDRMQSIMRAKRCTLCL